MIIVLEVLFFLFVSQFLCRAERIRYTPTDGRLNLIWNTPPELVLVFKKSCCLSWNMQPRRVCPTWLRSTECISTGAEWTGRTMWDMTPTWPAVKRAHRKTGDGVSSIHTSSAVWVSEELKKMFLVTYTPKSHNPFYPLLNLLGRGLSRHLGFPSISPSVHLSAYSFPEHTCRPRPTSETNGDIYLILNTHIP